MAYLPNPHISESYEIEVLYKNSDISFSKYRLTDSSTFFIFSLVNSSAFSLVDNIRAFIEISISI